MEKYRLQMQAAARAARIRNAAGDSNEKQLAALKAAAEKAAKKE